MAKTKKKLTKEEKLAKDRLRKKNKYAEMKSDPELYKILQEKEKKRYLDKKKKKKVVAIQEMSERAKREQRRRWRKNSLNYIKKKKEQKTIQRILIENSPPESEDEVVALEEQAGVIAVSADPLALSDTASTQKQEFNETPTLRRNKIQCQCPKTALRKLRYNNLKIRKELLRVQKENIILRRSAKQTRAHNKEEDTLEKKVNIIIKDVKDDKIEQVKRKLLFAESVTRGFLENYKKSIKKDKRPYSEKIVNKDKMKKYRVLSKLPFSLKKKNTETNQAKKIVKHRIQNFLEEDVNSQMAAGKGEYIKRGGVKKQKRYLADNLKNLHDKFCKQWGYISYSSFCKYRPFWINYPPNKRDTCQCKIHANIALLIEALRKACIIKEKTSTDVLKSLCCDYKSVLSINQKCLERSCNVCNTKVLHYAEFDNTINIKYYEWISEKQKYTAKNGREMFKNVTIKKKREDRPLIVIAKLDLILNVFFKHERNRLVQHDTIKELKQNLGANEVLCHVDFSENYCLKYHEEIQSFHFGGSRGQVSLHTGVLYYMDELIQPKTKSFCSMSQCLNHDASAIWAHIIPVLELSHRLVPTLTAIHFVSDSPSSQYRNRYIFYMLTKLRVQIPALQEVTWSYLEAGHGKGAPDGIGAAVKSAADNHVKYGGDVGSFQEFVEAVEKNVRQVELIVIPEEEVAKKRFPDNIPAFKGTTKVHQATWSSDFPYNVAFRSLSCFICRDSYIPCTHNKHLGVLSGIGEMATITRSKTPPVNDPAGNLSPDMFIHSLDSEFQDLDYTSLSTNVNIETEIMEKAQSGYEPPLFIDSPTILNNVGYLTNFDGNAIEEGVFDSTDDLDNNSKRKVIILSNLPYNYQRFTVRDKSAGFNSVDQSEFQKFLNSSSNDVEPHVDTDISNSVDLKFDIDMWVVVEYKNKSNSQFFIGKIIDRSFDTKEYKIIFVRKARGGLYGWPTVSDEDSVPESYIVQRLENPKESRRGQYTFVNLPKYNFK